MNDGDPPSGRITSSGKSRRSTLAATRRSWSSANWLAQQLLAYLAILGPGMIAASAGNDAGGIATFAAVGAEQGYRLLWILIPITISLGLVQEMCARMGAVTGKGLADLIREKFGVRWTAFVMLALLIANARRHGFRIRRHCCCHRALWQCHDSCLFRLSAVAFGGWW